MGMPIEEMSREETRLFPKARIIFITISSRIGDVPCGRRIMLKRFLLDLIFD